MVLQTIDRLNDKSWKTLGYIVLAFLLGFAAGNGHTTTEALKGQADWFQQDEHKKIVEHVRIEHEKDAKNIHHAIDADNK